ncbi:MAG: hypothetical protein ISS15_21115 [Alphaproteobacteria bacterium]|nr:hypothetical protein [Reyranella sp.]MBL6940080.1 hypothetical protein [Alphaproteobacteria bacterium]MBL7100167.1 hypothetical protein [Alphaproteobacteria bacterium]
MPTRMSRYRFDALADWCRVPGTRHLLPTVAAFSTMDEKALGVVFYDKTLGKGLGEAGLFGYVLLGRDAFSRYQIFDRRGPYITARAANKAVLARLGEFEGKAPAVPMSPKAKRGVDLFSLIKGVKNLDEKFINLRDSVTSSAARELLTEISYWFVDRDGNFAKDFQTTGFDGRLWELYLFATFTAMDFEFNGSSAVPDFCLARDGKKVFVEATTANATANVKPSIKGAPPPPPDDLRGYNEKEMVLKFGSPLESKVKKAYWDLPNVKGHPFVIAIADFHAPASMVWSQSALQIYLYGFGVEQYEEGGKIRWREKRLDSHVVGAKTIPSNFFGQERHKHISAILSSNAGTHAKFNRMGVQAGFGNDAVQLVRAGGLHVPGDFAYEPEPFRINVEDPDYSEDWDDELCVFHNPNAVTPLGDEMFRTAANYRLIDGEVLWTSPKRPVLFSSTRSLAFPGGGVDDIQPAKKPKAAEGKTAKKQKRTIKKAR